MPRLVTTRRPLPPLVAVLAALLLFAAGLSGAGPAAAETVSLPSGAATGSAQSDDLLATACPESGGCVVVGDYVDGAGHEQALIESESNGIWAGLTAPLTGVGPGSNPEASLTQVACPAVGKCVALGHYVDGSGNQQILIETLSNGTWTSGTVAISGLSKSAYPYPTLYQLACPSVGDCVAVGRTSDLASGLAMILTEANGSWTGAEAPVPGGSSAQSTLNSVSCAAAGSCVAVGYYEDGSGHYQGLLDIYNGASWSAGEVNLAGLSSVATNPNAALDSVSCAAPGDCTAVGRYDDAGTGGGSYQGLLVSSSGYVWSPATEAKLPANALTGGNAQDDLSLNSVACSAPGDCTAVGNYDATATPSVVEGQDVQGLLLTESGGVWSTGVEATLPVGGANPQVQIDAVSCRSAGNCTAAGVYASSGTTADAIILDQSAGTWSSTATAVAAGTDESYDNAASLACAPGGYCVAAGFGLASGGASDTAFLLDAPDAVIKPTVTDAYTQATVAWSAPVDTGGLPVTGYTVTANDLSDPTHGGQATSAAGAGASATVTGLTAGDTYTFAVTPQNALGSGLPATSTIATALPSPAQITASLVELLHLTGTGAKLKTIIARQGYVFRYGALLPGDAIVDWYVTTKHGRQPGALIASGHGTAVAAQTISVKATLNALGTRLVRSGRPVYVVAIVSFTTAGSTTSGSGTFTLP